MIIISIFDPKALKLKIPTASAASGNAFSPTAHFITLLFSEKKYWENSRVAFTNKAIAEMKERILFLLRFVDKGELEENYRSEVNIIHFYNEALKHAPEWLQNKINGRVEQVAVYRQRAFYSTNPSCNAIFISSTELFTSNFWYKVARLF